MNEHECKLCGYPYNENGVEQACEVCNAQEYTFWKLKIGFMYPAEAEELKRMIHLFLILLFIIALITLAGIGWLMTNTTIPNGIEV